MFDGIGYWTVYEEEVVKEYSNEGGKIHLTSQFANLSGLPIHYRSTNEYDDTQGRSSLDDFVGLLDDMELLLSKTLDATFTYTSGIPVLRGQRLTGGGIPKEVVGGGLSLDDGADFSFESNELDIKALDVLYKQLNQNLMDATGTPSASFGQAEISNLSETSIRLLFSLAEVKGYENEQYIRDGMMERYDKIRTLLEYRGVSISDEDYASLDLLFQYNQPSNETELIANLKTLRELQALSLKSLLERSPYTTDVNQEVDRMQAEGMVGEEVRVDVTVEEEEIDTLVR